MHRMIQTIGLTLLLIAAPARAAAEAEAPGHDATAHSAAAEGAAHGAAEHKSPPLLNVDGGGAAWTLILFVIVLVVLGKFVWPAIVKGLDAREAKVRGDIESAEAANRKAQATLAEYEARVAEAHAEARKMIDAARGDAEQVRARIVADTEADIARMRDRARAEIDAARNQAVADLYARSADLAVAVAEKILHRQIDAADTQKLVEQSLGELDKLSSAG